MQFAQNYDVVIIPEIVGATSFDDLYGILVTFMYDGGAVVMGPSPYDITLTGAGQAGGANFLPLYIFRTS